MFSPPDVNSQLILPNGNANSISNRDSPPGTASPNPTINSLQPPRLTYKSHRPRGSQSSNKIQGVIPIEEDVRRLFEECDIAKSNANVLSQALAFATPDALPKNKVIIVSERSNRYILCSFLPGVL